MPFTLSFTVSFFSSMKNPSLLLFQFGGAINKSRSKGCCLFSIHVHEAEGTRHISYRLEPVLHYFQPVYTTVFNSQQPLAFFFPGHETMSRWRWGCGSWVQKLDFWFNIKLPAFSVSNPTLQVVSKWNAVDHYLWFLVNWGNRLELCSCLLSYAFLMDRAKTISFLMTNVIYLFTKRLLLCPIAFKMYA